MKFHSNPYKQITFLKQIFQLSSSSRILDIGCHIGFHLQELQTISNTIYGIDIEKPKQELKNFILGDVFTTDLPSNLDGVYLLAPYFGDQWNKYQELLEKLNDNLVAGGKVVIDLFGFNDYLEGQKFQNYTLLPEKVILNNFIREIDNMHCKRTFLFKDWTQRSIELHWKVFNQNELENLAQNTGYKIQNIYIDFDVKLVTNLDPKLQKMRRVVVLEKL
jgi:SAM-dependent methyltransferase